jgi:polar amino acid transport system substrate-binding protein
MIDFAYLIEPPFNHRTPDGAVSGCDVELARTVLGMIGIRAFRPIEATFAELLPGLAQGRWRMTTGLFATDERRNIAAFSRPIWALPDGLLVRANNPLRLGGYKSVAKQRCVLAVVADQLQHRTAIEAGIPADRIAAFATYAQAADAVAKGAADAYASVARAHSAFLEARSEADMEVVTIPAEERPPAFGAFSFAKDDRAFVADIDRALDAYLGSPEHRAMMRHFGFADAEIDLIATKR